MGRYRSRSRSYSPRRSSRRSRTPPPKRRHYEDPRDRRSSRRSPAPTGLLVRNISLDSRPEDLRISFERFGAVKDVYIPKNYYTGEPRGFGFVKFRNPDDAAEAKHHLNHSVIGGREITIVFAEENRKTPQEMHRTSRVSERYGGSRRRRSPPRSPKRRYYSHSPSPSPARHASRDGDHRGRDDYSRSRSRSISNSRSPREGKSYKSDHRSKGSSKNDKLPLDGRDRDSRSPSPRVNGQSSRDMMDHGPGLRSPSPPENGRRLTPHSRSHSPSRSRSRSGALLPLYSRSRSNSR